MPQVFGLCRMPGHRGFFFLLLKNTITVKCDPKSKIALEFSTFKTPPHLTYVWRPERPGFICPPDLRRHHRKKEVCARYVIDAVSAMTGGALRACAAMRPRARCVDAPRAGVACVRPAPQIMIPHGALAEGNIPPPFAPTAGA